MRMDLEVWAHITWVHPLHQDAWTYHEDLIDSPAEYEDNGMHLWSPPQMSGHCSAVFMSLMCWYTVMSFESAAKTTEWIATVEEGKQGYLLGSSWAAECNTEMQTGKKYG